MTAAGPSAVPKGKAGPDSLASQQRHFLPNDLAGALKRLDDVEIDALLAAVTTEAERRGRRPPDPAKEKRVTDAKPQRRQDVAEDGAGSLTTGKLNAVLPPSKQASSPPQSQGNLEFRNPMSGRHWRRGRVERPELVSKIPAKPALSGFSPNGLILKT